MDNALQFVREGSVSYQSIPLLLAAAVWGGAKEMGLGEVGAQRGLVTAQATQPAGAEQGLGPSLYPLPVTLRAAGGGTANECVCGSLSALTGKVSRLFVGPGVGGMLYQLLEPQFLYLSCEGLSATRGSFEALMRKWDADPSPVPGLWGDPDSADVVPVMLRVSILGLCAHQPFLVSGELWVLGHFVALGPWAHPLVSLSLSVFILQVGVTTWLLCIKCIKCAGLAHCWSWVK